MQDCNLADQIAGLENAGPENAGMENEGQKMHFTWLKLFNYKKIILKKIFNYKKRLKMLNVINKHDYFVYCQKKEKN